MAQDNTGSLESRVDVCALSAGWTGSCHSDEKLLLAVQISHPAAA
jgi:hypothetical protein